jgi:hypothetical protein
LTKKIPFGQETLIKTLLQQKKPSIEQGKRDLVLVKREASALTMILALLLSMGAMTLHVDYCMPLSPDLHVYDDTAVYDIGGRGVNVTLTVDKPENKAYNSTVTFTLKVAQSYSAHGYTANPGDYSVSAENFGHGLICGVILDYDRTRIIDSVWINWGTSLNYEEERLLFLRSYDAVLTKSEDTYYGIAVLPELPEGSHNLTAWVRAQLGQVTYCIPFWAAFSKTVTFTIDTVAPNVTVLSSESNVYKTSSVPLNFTVNEPYSLVSYCLDGQENVAISGNTTLTGLPNGNHNFTVYATDEFGNTGASQIIYFSVEVPEPFPIALVAAASVAIVAVVGVGLLVYFKKRKR